jgi:hypothetical protein
MKSLLFKLGVILGVGDARRTKKQIFWRWFELHEETLFTFEKKQKQVFTMLTMALHQVHPGLTFEFGPVVEGRREFVISAGGDRAAFPW